MTDRHNKAADALADEWIAQHLGDDPDPRLWPSPEHGRVNKLTIVHGYRKIAEGERTAAAAPVPAGPLCSSCHLAQVAVRRTRRWGKTWTDLCSRCRKYVIRNGKLPSGRLNYHQAKRLGRLDWLEEAA